MNFKNVVLPRDIWRDMNELLKHIVDEESRATQVTG